VLRRRLRNGVVAARNGQALDQFEKRNGGLYGIPVKTSLRNGCNSFA
jgi:hypothetical protein